MELNRLYDYISKKLLNYFNFSIMKYKQASAVFLIYHSSPSDFICRFMKLFWLWNSLQYNLRLTNRKALSLHVLFNIQINANRKKNRLSNYPPLCTVHKPNHCQIMQLHCPCELLLLHNWSYKMRFFLDAEHRTLFCPLY